MTLSMPANQSESEKEFKHKGKLTVLLSDSSVGGGSTEETVSSELCGAR